MSLYDYSFTDNNGNEVSLSQFKDKVLLLVNVASNCGFTTQYEGLQAISKKYADNGVVVIGFPCNQFNSQEPGTDEEIKDFCTKNYGVDFLMSTKIDVNGDNAHSIFKHLLSESKVEDVPWNFTKFIVSEDSVKFLPPHSTAEEVEIELLTILK
jgi:glutathione peroxidase